MSIIWYVERELEKKGLTKVPDDDPATPDVFVRYYAKARSSIQGTPNQSQSMLPGGPESLTTSFDFSKVREGTLRPGAAAGVGQQGGVARGLRVPDRQEADRRRGQLRGEAADRKYPPAVILSPGDGAQRARVSTTVGSSGYRPNRSP